jgi:hypothetical protein
MDLPPQHASYSANSTRDRIKKSPRWDNDNGVAATIGTIMALLVFLAMMGIFTNQFVPVWMSDNESSHMSTAIEQFMNLKSSIDVSISNYPNSLIAPSPIYVPITLSSAGIPVFAGPTAGILTLLPDMLSSKTNFNLSYVWTTDGVRAYTIDARNDGHTGGYLELYCPNRYFVEQKMVYEAGAVILNQSDGEFILAGPQFSVNNVGLVGSPNLVVKLTQVSIEGTNKTIGGTGSKGVTAEMRFADSVAYLNNFTNNSDDLSITILSKHGIAWKNYFNRTLVAAGLVNNTNYLITSVLHTAANSQNNYYTVTVTIHNVKIFDHTRAMVTLSIGELGTI